MKIFKRRLSLGGLLVYGYRRIEKLDWMDLNPGLLFMGPMILAFLVAISSVLSVHYELSEFLAMLPTWVQGLDPALIGVAIAMTPYLIIPLGFVARHKLQHYRYIDVGPFFDAKFDVIFDQLEVAEESLRKNALPKDSEAYKLFQDSLETFDRMIVEAGKIYKAYIKLVRLPDYIVDRECYYRDYDNVSRVKPLFSVLSPELELRAKKLLLLIEDFKGFSPVFEEATRYALDFMPSSNPILVDQKQQQYRDSFKASLAKGASSSEDLAQLTLKKAKPTSPSRAAWLRGL